MLTLSKYELTNNLSTLLSVGQKTLSIGGRTVTLMSTAVSRDTHVCTRLPSVFCRRLKNAEVMPLPSVLIVTWFRLVPLPCA